MILEYILKNWWLNIIIGLLSKQLKRKFLWHTTTDADRFLRSTHVWTLRRSNNVDNQWTNYDQPIYMMTTETKICKWRSTAMIASAPSLLRDMLLTPNSFVIWPTTFKNRCRSTNYDRLGVGFFRGRRFFLIFHPSYILGLAEEYWGEWRAMDPRYTLRYISTPIKYVPINCCIWEKLTFLKCCVDVHMKNKYFSSVQLNKKIEYIFLRSYKKILSLSLPAPSLVLIITGQWYPKELIDKAPKTAP